MTMNRYIKVALAVVLVASTAACDEWLTGEKVATNPNQPTSAGPELLLNGVQATQFIQQTGALARVANMWVQAMAGTDRQYTSLDLYDFVEDDFTTEFNSVYVGGGLLDLRAIQDSAAARNDRAFQGIAQVWEAFTIGTAADIWGAIPYSQAGQPGTVPALDPQQNVYAAVQAKLDAAITNLTQATANGPAADLIYGGNRTRWIQAANTLKARYYMHWAEAQLRGNAAQQQAAQMACGGNCISKALAAAQLGISSPDGDFITFQSATPGEENVWYQFMFIQRDSYIRGGKTLIDLLNARNDPRALEFFEAFGTGGRPVGAPHGGTPEASRLNPATRGSPGFGQPLITWEENQLLWAEAAYHSNDQVTALARVNAVRNAHGLSPIAAAGSALLQAIAEEQYISLFQTIEAWAVWQRQCYPNFTLSGDAAFTDVPGRLYYGTDERNANENIPPPDEQPFRNLNDVLGGFVNPTGCIGSDDNL
jgi:hypothetical protein